MGCVNTLHQANLPPRAEERLRREQGKREESEEGVKPAQLVVHPPWNYASLGALRSTDTVQRRKKTALIKSCEKYYCISCELVL